MTTVSNLDYFSKDLLKVVERYPVLINDYYRDLARTAGDSIARQIIPDPAEISPENDTLAEDPVGEDVYSPAPNLSHRYRDRILFLVSDRCPVYCRFCTRKRKVGRNLNVTEDTVDAGLEYIRGHHEIRDVLLSGGDPLMLEDDKLESILRRVKEIDHIQIIRIGTRVPSALPMRITKKLGRLLADQGPLYVHTHFNHPAELTPQSREACRILADAGIPLNNQTVLLRGINDDPDTLEQLFRELLVMRVQPYYLFQMDLVKGTRHFSTPLMTGIRIMEELHRRTSPMALPAFAVDLPGGLGKVFPSRTSITNPGTDEQAIIVPGGKVVPYRDRGTL